MRIGSQTDQAVINSPGCQSRAARMRICSQTDRVAIDSPGCRSPAAGMRIGFLADRSSCRRFPGCRSPAGGDVSWLLFKLSDCKLARLPNSGDRDVSWLLNRSSDCNLPGCRTPEGRGMLDGSETDRVAIDSPDCRSPVEGMSVGCFSSSLTAILARLPISDGIEVSWLLNRSSDCRFARLPISGGMDVS